MARIKRTARAGPAVDNGLAGNPPLDPAYNDPGYLAAYLADVKKMKRQFRADNNLPDSDSDSDEEGGDATQMMSSPAVAEQESGIKVSFTLAGDDTNEEAIDDVVVLPMVLPGDWICSPDVLC
jgi:hypothetical protein